MQRCNGVALQEFDLRLHQICAHIRRPLADEPVDERICRFVAFLFQSANRNVEARGLVFWMLCQHFPIILHSCLILLGVYATERTQRIVFRTKGVEPNGFVQIYSGTRVIF